MSEYSVVFAGEVVDGFDPDEVRRAAAGRLKASEAQTDRLFCGRKAVIKKGLTAEQGARYLMELRKLGMVIRLERAGVDAGTPAGAAFRVIFHGEIIDGFAADEVAEAAGALLKLAPEHIEQVFSGRKVVLRKGLSGERGWLFVAELARVGMLASLEPMAASAAEADKADTASDPTPEVAAVKPPAAPIAHKEPEPGHDLAATMIVSNDLLDAMAAEAAMPAPIVAAPAPIKPATPKPTETDIGQAATLIVGSEMLAHHTANMAQDAAERAEHAKNAPHAFPVEAPPPPLMPTPGLAPINRMPQRPEGEELVPLARQVRCANCNHKQPLRKRCMACGFLLAPAVDTPLQDATPSVPPSRPTLHVPMAASMGEPTVMSLADPFDESEQSPAKANSSARTFAWAVGALIVVAILVGWWISRSM